MRLGSILERYDRRFAFCEVERSSEVSPRIGSPVSAARHNAEDGMEEVCAVVAYACQRDLPTLGESKHGAACAMRVVSVAESARVMSALLGRAVSVDKLPV